MSIIQYRPRTLDLFNWDRVFDRYFGDFDHSAGWPAVDVREDDDNYLVEVELPGLSEKDVEVKVENGVLTIASRKDESREEKDEGYIRKERRHYSFSRSFSLPDNVDGEKITANFKNGLLDVAVPKAPAAKPKLIEVKSK
ncbi:MAG: Hsp20/alpha crystallin family protein [Spirochaetes bacterium]|nr:Hsp20/alpha crystallin family protein [Spirochaetota bacterium]